MSINGCVEPPVVGNPSPADGAYHVSKDVILHWNTGVRSKSHQNLSNTICTSAEDKYRDSSFSFSDTKAIESTLKAPDSVTSVAIFQDRYPWNRSWNKTILEENGISCVIYNSDNIGSVSLEYFDKIIIPSTQTSEFYMKLSAYRGWFEEYVYNGGILDLHLCSFPDESVDGWIMPGDFVTTLYVSDDLTIVDGAHRVITAPHFITDSQLDNWSNSTHGYFSSIPFNAHEILKITANGEPCAMDLELGEGRIFATVQAVERLGASYEYLENTILNDLLDDGCSTQYKVYFDTSNPPMELIFEGSDITICEPGALFPNTTYYWKVEATNSAGSTVGSVWKFRSTGSNPDFFTEQYEYPLYDLSNHSLVFTPNNSSNYYSGCIEPADSFPNETTNANAISLYDDSYMGIILSDGKRIPLYGKLYDTFYIGSNGYITFTAGDYNYLPTLDNHFSLPRISGLFTDIYPDMSGKISWEQMDDRVVVTYYRVPSFFFGFRYSFQIEMFFDGMIRITWLEGGADYCIVGLSCGNGVPSEFENSDFSEYSTCLWDDLVISPDDPFLSAGIQGGPFSPVTKTYNLTNISSRKLYFSVHEDAEWLEPTSESAFLWPGVTADLSLNLTEAANSLPVGTYKAQVSFINDETGYVQERDVCLEISRIPGEIEVCDSIVPKDDLEMHFAPQSIESTSSQTEHITVTNTGRGILNTSDIFVCGGDYFEDFNDGLAQGWQEDMDVDWEIVNGEYRASDRSVYPSKQSVFMSGLWRDCTASVTVRSEGNEAWGATLYVRASDDFNLNARIGTGYFVQSYGSQNYAVGKLISGEITYLQYFKYSEYLIPEPSPNKFTISIEDNIIRVYFNDYPVWCGSDDSISSEGRIGLSGIVLYGSSLCFDNVLVSDFIPQDTFTRQKDGNPEVSQYIGAFPGTALQNTYENSSSEEPGIAISDITKEGDYAFYPYYIQSLSELPIALLPGESFEFDVVFEPDFAGEFLNSLVIKSDDPETPNLSLLLESKVNDLIEIEHEPIEKSTDLDSYEISAEIITVCGTVRMELFWKKDDDSFTIIPLTQAGSNSYHSSIPGHNIGDWISYYIEVEDETGYIKTHPPGAPENTHSFQVQGIPDLQASTTELDFDLPAGSQETRSITITNNGTWPSHWSIIELTDDLERARVPEPSRSTAETVRPTVNWDAEQDANTLLIGFINELSRSKRASVHASIGTKVVHSFKLIPVDVISIPSGSSKKDVASAYRMHGKVEYIEPNYRIKMDIIPNDPALPELWGMHNTGQTGGVDDADIDAPEAWEKCTGNREIIIGITDSGIDYTHPDLASNMWMNEEEFNGTPGIDDDGNGIIDDIHGACWLEGTANATSADPIDTYGHGTHVAGIIGAVGDNDEGIAGVNWTVRLMALKFVDEYEGGYSSDAIAALEYAVEKGAFLTNNSWGNYYYNQAMKDAIQAAGEAGHLFITSANNDAYDNDIYLSYPSSYDLENIIAVASSDKFDNLSNFSNYGAVTVDLAAPGTDVYSTFPGDGYYTASGTSMAAPFVSGVAGLLYAKSPGANYHKIKRWIMDGVDLIPLMEGLTLTGGRLNAANSLTMIGFPWLEFDKYDGDLNPGESVEILISVDTAEFDYNTVKSEKVLIAGDDPSDSIEISVSLNAGTDIYVSGTTGDDGNSGSRMFPFRTIGHAVDYLSGDLRNPVSIHVASGDYVENIRLNEYQSIFGGYSTDFFERNVKSNSGLEYVTILDGGGLGSVVTLAGTESEIQTVSGFTIKNGSNSSGGGGIEGNGSLATISDNIIFDNFGKFGAGISDCDGRIVNNIIHENISSDSGGGLMYCDGLIVNNVIYGNKAKYGGGLATCQAAVFNNTICENQADQYGGGMYQCTGKIANCILWMNLSETGAQVHECSTPEFSCIQDWPDVKNGDFSSDPMFAASGENNYHIQPLSPCVDTGMLVNCPDDFDGDSRPFANGYDIGYDENTSIESWNARYRGFPGDSMAFIEWEKAYSLSPPVSYHVFISTQSGMQDFEAPAVFSTEEQYTIDSLINGTSYFIVIRAVDSEGNKTLNTNEIEVVPGPNNISGAVYNSCFESGTSELKVSGKIPGKPEGWSSNICNPGEKNTTYYLDDANPYEGNYSALVETSGSPANPDDLTISILKCDIFLPLQKDHTYVLSAAIKRSHSQWARLVLHSSGYGLIYTNNIDALDNCYEDSGWQRHYLYLRVPTDINAYIRFDSIVTNRRTEDGRICRMWVDDIQMIDLGMEDYVNTYNDEPNSPRYGIRNSYFDIGSDYETASFGNRIYCCENMPKHWNIAMAIDIVSNDADASPIWGQEIPPAFNESSIAGYIKAKANDNTCPSWPALSPEGVRINTAEHDGRRHVLLFDYGARGMTLPLLRVYMIRNDFSCYSSLFIDPLVQIPGNKMWPLSVQYLPEFGDNLILVRFDNVTLGASGSGVHTDETAAYINNVWMGVLSD